ncbi:MAG: hypothetical protein MMC23_008267 [Stictis urceolatum]|nr:hypothetical protein [Stictis urceolata]
MAISQSIQIWEVVTVRHLYDYTIQQKIAAKAISHIPAEFGKLSNTFMKAIDMLDKHEDESEDVDATMEATDTGLKLECEEVVRQLLGQSLSRLFWSGFEGLRQALLEDESRRGPAALVQIQIDPGQSHQRTTARLDSMSLLWCRRSRSPARLQPPIAPAGYVELAGGVLVPTTRQLNPRTFQHDWRLDTKLNLPKQVEIQSVIRQELAI